jgi:sporulation protein YlmC with PRC-barrel domain
MAATVVKDSDLMGKHVILEDACDVGTVGDIYVDVYDWHITRFDLVVDKKYIERLGAEKSVIRKSLLPIKTHLVSAVGDVVHLTGGIEDLRRSTRSVQPHEAAKEPVAAPDAKDKAKADEPKRSAFRKGTAEEKPRKL